MKAKNFLLRTFCFPLTLMMGIPGDGNGGTGGSQNGGDGQPPKTFTQEEVTGLLAAEKTKGKNDVYALLGIEEKDAGTAKENLGKYQAILDGQKSDVEKAQGETVKEKTARETAEAKVALYESKFEALKNGVKVDCVDDIIAMAAAKVTKEKPLETVLTELKEKYPAMFNESGNGDNSGSGSNGTGNNVHGKKTGGDANDVVETAKKLAEEKRKSLGIPSKS